MTLEEARDHIGHGVLYSPCGGPVEEGVITSVNEHYVFVRFGADKASKATRAADLILLANAEAYKNHSPGCQCPVCRAAEENGDLSFAAVREGNEAATAGEE